MKLTINTEVVFSCVIADTTHEATFRLKDFGFTPNELELLGKTELRACIDNYLLHWQRTFITSTWCIKPKEDE